MDRNCENRLALALGIGLILAAPTAAQVRDVQAADLGALVNAPQITRLYVSASAQGANDGSSWSDAFVSLQDALGLAEAPGSAVQEVWVARGTYKPAPLGGDRAVSFRLVGGVTVYGGFSGWEDMLDQRDPSLNETILSGDLNGDDVQSGENTGENSVHVVTWDSDFGTSILDGFTVTEGNADGGDVWPYAHGEGGGILIYHGLGDVRLANCIIRRNSAIRGGGLVSSKPNTVIDNCFFDRNSANDGGGLYVSYSIEVRGCRFVSNVANNGGAVYSPSYIITPATIC